MEAYQQRVFDERAELNQRTNKLATFMGSPEFQKVEHEQRTLLVAQHGVMITYSYLLTQRLKAMGVI